MKEDEEKCISGRMAGVFKTKIYELYGNVLFADMGANKLQIYVIAYDNTSCV